MSNPFGGPQGPGQQPYGQQPPQQPYGQPQQQPNFYAGPPPVQPQQQRRPWLKWLRIGVPVVIIAVVAIVYFTKEDSTAESAKVGDCMEHTEKNGKDDIKKAECGTPQGQYTVVGKFSGTTDTDKCQTVAAWQKDVAFQWNDNGTKVLLCLNANADAPDPLG